MRLSEARQPARDPSGRGPCEVAAAYRLAVETSNARTEHQRPEQLWALVSMNFGPQNCGAVSRMSVQDQGAARMIDPMRTAMVTANWRGLLRDPFNPTSAGRRGQILLATRR